MQESSWFANCYRQGFRNLGNRPAIANFDARRLARYWKDAGAELVYMDAIAQGWTFFPTKQSTLASHMKGRDLVGEFLGECRRLKLRAGAYITPFEHAPFTREHPEWCQTKTDGTHHEAPAWVGTPYYWACWNSPFLDRMCSLIEELFTRYPLDAAFFDGLLSRHGVCHCPSCKEKFKADTGFDLPSVHDMADPAFAAYYQWKMQSLTHAAERIFAAARVKNPDVQIVSNTPVAWCNWCSVQPEDFIDLTEFTCIEIQPMAVDTPGFWHIGGVANSAYLAAYTRGQGRLRAKVQAYDWVGYGQANIDVDVELELKAAAAQGCLPCIQSERPGVKRAFTYLRRCEPFLFDTRPVTWAAIAASQESCDTHRVHEAVNGAYFEDMRGLFYAMHDLRVPTEFINGRDLGEEGQLDDFRVLLLSDMGRVNPRQAEAIRAFVRAGGGLIATAATSLIGADGRPQRDFDLADLFGVHAAPRPDWPETSDWMGKLPAYLYFARGKTWWGDASQPGVTDASGQLSLKQVPWMASNRTMPLWCDWQPVSAAPGSRVVAEVRSASESKDLPALPGLVTRRYGRGRVVYLAPRFGELFARYPYAVWRNLLQAALDFVAPAPPPLEVDAPQCVSAYAWEQPATGRWMIHLINDLDETGRPRGRMGSQKNDQPASYPRTRPIPVGPVDVVVRKPGARRVELPLEGRRLKATPVEGGLKVRLTTVGPHTLLAVS